MSSVNGKDVATYYESLMDRVGFPFVKDFFFSDGLLACHMNGTIHIV